MKRSWGILETLAAMIALAIILAIFMPVYSGRPASPGATCRSNLRQVGTALQIYAGDFDDRTPVTNWSLAIEPYIKSIGQETCPLVAKEKRQFGYALNSAVAGIDLGKLGHPDTVVGFFETDALGRGVIANLAARNDDRHDGYSLVGYMDTHVKSIKKGAKP